MPPRLCGGVLSNSLEFQEFLALSEEIATIAFDGFSLSKFAHNVYLQEKSRQLVEEKDSRTR